MKSTENRENVSNCSNLLRANKTKNIFDAKFWKLLNLLFGTVKCRRNEKFAVVLRGQDKLTVLSVSSCFEMSKMDWKESSIFALMGNKALVAYGPKKCDSYREKITKTK